jgi:alanine racemase
MGPTKVEIYHQNLIHNLTLIRKSVSPSRVMAVVKANGYGHGSIETARTLVKNGVDFLAVAFHEEGIELRRAGITVPILVFGAQLPHFVDAHLEYDLDITLTAAHQIDYLKRLHANKQKKARVHVKVDTGMNRVGFNMDYFQLHAQEILNAEHYEVVGIYSHLSSSDEDDLTYTRLQLERFVRVRQTALRVSRKKPLFHLANSGAIMRLPEAYFDYVRPGVMLYGNPPSPDFKLTWDLREVMRFVSTVTLIKNVDEGEPISYSRRYYTKQKTKIAVIPVGYADGYNRLLTNTGTVLIRGNPYPVAGTVCMDQILVDLGPGSTVKVGDEAVLFGKQEKQHIKIIEMARQLKTIPYEITCWPSVRVPRIHKHNE